ncbi:hypothetical protein BI147_00085 [Achromobacter xylosoxidans]|uniref:protein-export chaperone SecB n=1 Tax=Alcaligenes xylosoxydans xylosoxydans TaxID=85698 RepID=UPI000970737F|nr:protein-export chaperone SecB [Achromobacter xylosoxidans]MCZ8388263.1 protein-export chaperone SecB [Achromobacter xylosoxidans]OMG91579.1 hypothetical protein BI147_00085 [Achromobacter xylosoxidans]
MNLSPLQLEHYHFYQLSLVSRDDIEIDLDRKTLYPPIGEDEVHTKVALLTSDEPDPHEFIVRLRVRSELTSANEGFPYTFDVDIEGMFSIEHDGEIEERKRLVVCNGASILYGSIREQILSLSARHRYGPVMLPTASFLKLAPADDPPPSADGPEKTGRKRASKKKQ